MRVESALGDVVIGGCALAAGVLGGPGLGLGIGCLWGMWGINRIVSWIRPGIEQAANRGVEIVARGEQKIHLLADVAITELQRTSNTFNHLGVQSINRAERIGSFIALSLGLSGAYLIVSHGTSVNCQSSENESTICTALKITHAVFLFVAVPMILYMAKEIAFSKSMSVPASNGQSPQNPAPLLLPPPNLLANIPIPQTTTVVNNPLITVPAVPRPVIQALAPNSQSSQNPSPLHLPPLSTRSVSQFRVTAPRRNNLSDEVGALAKTYSISAVGIGSTVVASVAAGGLSIVALPIVFIGGICTTLYIVIDQAIEDEKKRNQA